MAVPIPLFLAGSVFIFFGSEKRRKKRRRSVSEDDGSASDRSRNSAYRSSKPDASASKRSAHLLELLAIRSEIDRSNLEKARAHIDRFIQLGAPTPPWVSSANDGSIGIEWAADGRRILATFEGSNAPFFTGIGDEGHESDSERRALCWLLRLTNTSCPTVIDEMDLETDDEPAGSLGIFEIKEEHLPADDGDDYGYRDLEDMNRSTKPSDDDAIVPSDIIKEKCDEFFHAIYVAPTEDGEIPINKIAAEHTAIPAMNAELAKHADKVGAAVDINTVAPSMVISALTELVPVCRWAYDYDIFEVVFNNGLRVKSDAGRSVIHGLFQLSDSIIEEFNNAVTVSGQQAV